MRDDAPPSGPRARSDSAGVGDLILGLLGAIAVCVGSFGVGDIARNSTVAQDLGLAAISYGHGKTLFGTIFWLGVATMVIAWVRLGRTVARRPPDPDLDGGRSRMRQSVALPSVRTMRLGILAWAAPLAVAVPVYSRDVYAYLGQGAVFREGFDPYVDGPAHHPGPLLDSMAQVWATTTAPYGPFFVGVMRGITEITGDHAILGVYLIRLALLPGLLLALWAIPRLAHHFGASPQAGLWLALANPMVLIHLVSGAHVELLMMGVLVAGVTLVVTGRHVPGLVVLGLAVSIKVTAGIAIPFVVWIWLAHIRARRPVRPADVAGVFASVVGITVAVFAVCTAAVGLGLGWLSGLGFADQIINWFTLPTLAGHVVTLVASPFVVLNLQPVLAVTRAVGSVVLALVLVALWWTHRRDERSAMAGMVWAMLAVLVLEPSTLPWYYTWVLCLAVAFTLPGRVRAAVVFVSTFMLIVFQPDDSILFYKPVEVLLAAALSALAAVSLGRPDPLRLRRVVDWFRDRPGSDVRTPAPARDG
ncbi:alpha-(1-_6)-mannopyranosyltransferase A [Gordonia sp. OPL2]|uniref:alpha-(1->6)-mannopyranosyltransferase A n=1 Tax=Gordonia sp. OPL2 TaxID=2486274 RepID=UPI0016552D1A|nr:alpha-(1->6)-mannopyranosyltransferase A [Gordonia sp. OPL2]ROZ87660.1 alpha-(1->6)-mannopyranosyltransferase A [Gordonia sp. OPL2]